MGMIVGMSQDDWEEAIRQQERDRIATFGPEQPAVVVPGAPDAQAALRNALDAAEAAKRRALAAAGAERSANAYAAALRSSDPDAYVAMQQARIEAQQRAEGNAAGAEYEVWSRSVQERLSRPEFQKMPEAENSHPTLDELAAAVAKRLQEQRQAYFPSPPGGPGPLQEFVLAEQAVAYLNSAFAADPAAIHALLINKVPVTGNGLPDHPHVVCDQLPTGSGYFMVGMLGVLVGMMAAMGLPRIAAKFSDERDEDGRAKLLGFCIYGPDQPKTEGSTKCSLPTS